MTFIPEAEMLLICASPVKRGSPLNLALDWPVLQELAASHRLLPLLYWELKRLQPAAIPASLAESFHANLQNSLMLTGELIRVLELFEREGIDAIPFKGPTLAITAYNNLALRRFDDLDIILRPEDVWRARDLLFSIGYTSGLKLSPARESDYLGAYDELILSSPGEATLLELHWKFLPAHFGFPLDLDDCWPRRETVLLGKQPVPSLNPEDLLLVLAVHGSKHCWSYLGLIADVAWLIRKQPIAWDSLLKRAEAIGVHRMVLLAALLASRTLAVPLADLAAKAIKADPAVTVLADRILRSLFGVRHDERSMRANARMHIRMRERLSDRLRYCFRLIFRPGIEDWQLLNLPGSFSFLYRLLRFPRLALKYRPRRTSFYALLLAIMVAGLCLLAARHAGQWLELDEPLQRSTAIVVLGGGVPFRPMEAARLYQEGWAREAWVTQGTPDKGDLALAAIGLAVSHENERSEEILLKMGVPAEAIRVLPGRVDNTVAELRAISARLGSGARVILVTSKYHSRRVRVIWNAVARQRLATVRYTPEDPYDADRWWGTSTDALATFREIFGILNAWAGFPVVPKDQ